MDKETRWVVEVISLGKKRGGGDISDFLAVIVDGEDILGCAVLDRYLRLKAEYPPEFSEHVPSNVLNSCTLLSDVGDYVVLGLHSGSKEHVKYVAILLPRKVIVLLQVRFEIAGESIARELISLFSNKNNPGNLDNSYENLNVNCNV